MYEWYVCVYRSVCVCHIKLHVNWCNQILFVCLFVCLFLDCIFKILPMQRYSAQEQFKKATQSTKTMPDIVILQKLGVSLFHFDPVMKFALVNI